MVEIVHFISPLPDIWERGHSWLYASCSMHVCCLESQYPAAISSQLLSELFF